MAYCTIADLYSYGLPRGGLPNPYRLVADVSVGGDALSLDNHGLVAGNLLTFRAEAGGSLPSPLTPATTYYALPVDDNTFQVEASLGGGPVNFTTAGESVAMITPLPIQAAIDWGFEIVNNSIPAHAVPQSPPYAAILVMTNAELAVQKLLWMTGQRSESLTDMIIEVGKRLERWAKGVVIRGTNKPTSVNLAVSAGPGTNARWPAGSGGCI